MTRLKSRSFSQVPIGIPNDDAIKNSLQVRSPKLECDHFYEFSIVFVTNGHTLRNNPNV